MSTTILRKQKKSGPLFTATCATGLEELVKEEIATCGGTEITSKPGAVTWHGRLETGYRACLWSRFASRILYEIYRFDAADTDTLYEKCQEVRWDDHFTLKKSFAVHATLVNSPITHSQFASLRVKDAIADQFRHLFGKRPNVNPLEPDVRINLHMEGSTASLSIDLSGESLHRRGYRGATGEAPLKETLAAAIVRLSGWLDRKEEEPILLDPMCGSGTLLIEAALMCSGSAPGLQRERFGFMGWNKHDPALWERLVTEALEKETAAEPDDWPQFIGYDADPRAVAAARKNVIAAGLRDRIIIRHRQLARLHSPGQRGTLLTNPPYGERLTDKTSAQYLYTCLGRIFRREFPGWHFCFFTANPEFADIPALIWQNQHQLYNGPLKCRLLVGQESRPGADMGDISHYAWSLSAPEKESPGEDFANRLVKNYQGLEPWLTAQGIECFRLYDADMPEYNVAVDCYGQWVHVQEYAPPSTIDPAKAEERLKLALQVIRQVLDVPHSRLFIKSRQKQKGKDQYQKKNPEAQGKLYEAREGGASFLLNFTDYLDTGLFLDHRPIRARLSELAQGKTFLNLFAYTGAASVYAAMGGATSTVTVDVSENYLARARANLSLNGFGGPLHQLIASDCLDWLKGNQERFGVIFVDPPTFSNARHRKETFDIQKDHSQLLRLSMQRLTRNGVLIFSTNFRKFELNPALAKEFAIEEISAETIPLDFARNKRIHRCWEFRFHP